MGVKGLSTFIDDNKEVFLTDHRLHNTRIIVDGSNLFHFLYYHYKISHQFGGDYDHFARKCKRFFNILKECRITPYIVFDGGYDPDDRKLPTVLERMNDRRKKVGLICAKGRGCVLPILAYESFRQVLVELNIAHVACVFEADREIAVLAKRWKCPVLSNDSDFFVFGLEGGFVPLDYINLTLCVYNTQTGKQSVLGKNDVLNENEVTYIPVKYYNCDRFLKMFDKEDDSYILPMFATVIGNDYVDYSMLYTFYHQLHAPKNPSNKKLKVIVSGLKELVLHWLAMTNNENEAFESVLSTILVSKREKTEQILRKSFTEYKNIEEFASFDLENVLESDRDSLQEVNASSRDAYLKDEKKFSLDGKELSTLMDFYGQELPKWFIWKMRTCELHGGFLQNVTVVHRLVFNCQVEMLRETSSYACSRDLRAVIYGIVINNVEEDGNTEKLSRDNCVEEYDREGKNMKKFFVKPARNVAGFENQLMLEKVPMMSVSDRMTFLYKAFEFQTDMPREGLTEPLQVMMLIVAYWVKHAEPKVKEAHVSALIVSIFILHINTLDWVKMKKSLGYTPFEPVFFEDIIKACESTDARKLDFFKKHMERYFGKPEHSSRFPRDNKVVHGFSQFQTTFLDALYLIQVLIYPVTLPSPSVLLNGTFLYNLCRDLDGRVHPNNYLNDMLGNGSPLQTLFHTLKNAVITLCKGSSFDGDKEGNSMAGYKTKSKSKAKKSKELGGKKKVSKEEVDDGSDSEEENEMTAEDLDVEVNCDVNNRFAALLLSD